MDSKILDIHPLKLQFPFEANKRTSCPLSLTSKADQYVRFCIIPEFKDMYLCEENELVNPMSTCGVSITLVEQQQRSLKMIYVLMITSESESALENFMTSISWDDMMDKVDLPQRVEELGCQMHVAMVTGAVCPQSVTTITPKVSWIAQVTHQIKINPHYILIIVTTSIGGFANLARFCCLVVIDQSDYIHQGIFFIQYNGCTSNGTVVSTSILSCWHQTGMHDVAIFNTFFQALIVPNLTTGFW